MGIFEKLFPKPRADAAAQGYFKMLNGYTPVFTNAPESIYEMEITRADPVTSGFSFEQNVANE